MKIERITSSTIKVDGRVYPIFRFPHDEIHISFFDKRRQIEKPINYIGVCRLKTVQPHHKTRLPFTHICNGVFFYIDPEGDLFMVGRSGDNYDPPIGKIYGEFFGFNEIEEMRIDPKDFIEI